MDLRIDGEYVLKAVSRGLKMYCERVRDWWLWTELKTGQERRSDIYGGLNGKEGIHRDQARIGLMMDLEKRWMEQC